MDLNGTEEQKVEAIKELWSKYALPAIGGLIIGLAGYYGWNEYQRHIQDQNAEASDAYEDAIEKIEQPEKFLEAVQVFDQSYDHQAYQSFLHLRAAKILIEKEKWNEGKSMLQSVVKSDLRGISEVAAIRLARVHVELEEYDAALSRLDTILGTSFESLKQEIRGDIYEKQGKIKLAPTMQKTMDITSVKLSMMKGFRVQQMSMNDQHLLIYFYTVINTILRT